MPDGYRTAPALALRDEIDRMTIDEVVLARHLLLPIYEGPTDLSRFLRRLADHVDTMPSASFEIECNFERGLLAHFRAAPADFRDDERRAVTRGPNRTVLSLDEADLNKRAATGHGLATLGDYTHYKPAWGPNQETIRRHFGSLDAALRACGLDERGQPEAHLIRQQGHTGGLRNLTLDERAEYLARGIERNYGRRVTYEGWDDIREVLGPGSHPSAHQLVGRHRTGADHEWRALHELAYAHALQHRQRFPYTCAYKADVDRLRRVG